MRIDPIWMPDTQQLHFRLLLEAMARPGQIYPLAQLPQQGSVVLSVLSTLLDAEVSLADPHGLLNSGDWPMLQVKAAPAELADYVVCDAQHSPDFSPKLGTLPCPEQSATLILLVDSLNDGNTHLQLSGPGIKTSTHLRINGLNTSWLTKREDWVCAFPLGADLILVDPQHIAALPRTTRVEIM